ncbi:MAG TPA: helix-turn-helix domain-containing protein [Marmoricola sp.]|nr:helix-turn-helix domain-containing protein [Marmoricola sp.]
MPDAESARRHGVTVQTIRRWRRAYQRQGVTRGQTPCLRRAHSAPGCPSRRSPMRSYWAGTSGTATSSSPGEASTA